jgi:alkylation response protein AidB-like acyl-CoA dehydrogenase
MDFTPSPRQLDWRNRVRAFIDAHVLPNLETYDRELRGFGAERWQVVPIVEELKPRARAEGLWNLALPPSEHDEAGYRGAGLSNLEYALCAEEMGRVEWASEVFNCSAPDTGNMEVLHRYGTAEQKARWLRPLLDGEIRSAFLMTEPQVASSDATNIETAIVRDGTATSLTAASGGRPAWATRAAGWPS